MGAPRPMGLGGHVVPGCAVEDVGLRVPLGFRVWGLGFRV